MLSFVFLVPNACQSQDQVVKDHKGVMHSFTIASSSGGPNMAYLIYEKEDLDSNTYLCKIIIL